jgi:PAS domain S-box-containing protein
MTMPDSPNSLVTGVDDVLITAELASRRSRGPDYEAESRALGLLAQEMATHPGGVLRKCAELVMELCQADSAGISLLEPGGEHGHFRWQAIVGTLAGYWGGTIPREASPCGVVIARDSVLLFRQAERFFPILKGMEPRAHETLLAPWHSNGEPVGTLWAIKHTREGRFDAEDARLLQSLARLAAAAHQMSGALDDAKAGQEALRESEERFRSLVEGWAQAVWETDTEGTVITDSPSWRGYTGQSLEEWLDNNGWANAIHPDDRAAVQQVWREAVRERRPLNTEHRLRRAGGGWRWTNVHAVPLLAPDGTVRKWVGMNIDITERKEAEEALRKSEERFQYCARATRDIIWDIDLVTDRVWESEALRTQMGYAPEEIGPDTAWCLAHIHPDDQERVVQGFKQVAAGTGEHWSDEYRYRRADGSYAHIVYRGFILRDEHGRAVRMIGAMQDITERKKAEEALRASESRARLLLGELQHRVRNTLAVIRSIVRRTAETSQSVEDYAMHLDGRINAFARVQTAVARDPTAGLDLTELVADELLTYVAHDGEQVRIAGPAVRLKPKAAETFGLAVHELATNAVKHGALSVPDGRIRVTWRVHNGTDVPRLVFEWKESGTPDRAAKRKRRGFGTDLLERTLTYELKAKTVQTFEPDGLRCTIELPMTERIVIGNSASPSQQD